MNTEPKPDEDRLLRLPEVVRLCGVKKTKIYDLIKNGHFPKVRKVGRASVWPESQVLAWKRAIVDQ